MTRKLYLDQSYDTAFEAAVLSSSTLADGRQALVLDRTLFYPESGGQLPDHGTLGLARVVDVQEGDDETVIHTLAGGDAPAGTVRGEVDWARRFDHMQQHTGQHVLSRAFIQAAGLHTVSFHMGDDVCTIDLDGSGFDESAVRRAEDVANRIVEENRPLDIVSIPVAELDVAELRRKVPEGVTIARIVSVRDFDSIPCCGTHVRSTGELGLVKVLKSEKVKQQQRVHFKVGARALQDYREKHALLQGLAGRLTTAIPDVGPKVERLLDDAQAASKRMKVLTQRLVAAEAPRLASGARAVGSARVLVFREGDAAYARALATEFQSVPGLVAIVAAEDGTVVVAGARDVAVDLATGVSAIARQLGGSGGGKGAFAQLKLDAGRLGEALERIEAHVVSLLA